jgi:hypothetical protein
MPVNQSLSDGLKTQHLGLEPMIANAKPERMNYCPAPGKWSVLDNIAHLASYQTIFIQRLKQILEEDGPVFARYSADYDPLFESWRKFDIEELMRRMKANRDEINDLVLNLSDDQLERVGHHPKFGRLSIINWLEFFLLHEAHHFFTIYRLIHDVDLEA